MSVLHGDVTDEHIGWLDEVKHVLIAGKSYVHLQRHECPVVTVVLCNRHEEALEELKVRNATIKKELLKCYSKGEHFR